MPGAECQRSRRCGRGTHAARRLSALVAACISVAVSCSAPGKGALILSISTDMQAPKDIDVVSVFISNNGTPRFNFLGRVNPNGSVSLPSTLAIVESDSPTDQIRIRVTGFQNQKARVLRDVITTVPHQRTALLRMPLNFLDDGSASGSLPASLVPGGPGGAPEGDTTFDPTDPQNIRSTCDITKNLTSIGGTCVDARVDSSKLRGYVDDQVFGAGGSADNPTCFDVTTCFAHSMIIRNVDMPSCSFPLPPGATGSRWNCALATTNGTGVCSGQTCLVPLETDPGEGFSVQNGTIGMVSGVCAKLMQGAILYADNSATCGQKNEAAPVCQSAGGGAGDAGPSSVDATEGGNVGDSPGNGDSPPADGSPADSSAADSSADEAGQADSGQADASASGVLTATDCPGCTFPALGAAACSASAPAIKVVYPTDGVLLPPNLSAPSIQWTPYGPPYTTYEVDLANAVTSVRIITKCAAQTVDQQQPPTPSGGCQLVPPAATWTAVANANRGGAPMVITVRGTTDGNCATTSVNNPSISFASQDLAGTISYFKSTVTANGVGGQVWAKTLSDASPERQITGLSGGATCYGCHAVSRDGARMVAYADDDDSDDEYSDVRGILLDLTSNAALIDAGVAGDAALSGIPPGFSALSPTHAYFLSTNGLGAAPTNNFTLWDANSGAQRSTVTVGSPTDRPSMPDWSADGTSVVYVLPSQVASWDTTARNDDNHLFGGSLYTLPYNAGTGTFGTPTPLLQSAGENNYYPAYSPDGQFVVFDRVALNAGVPGVTGCTGVAPQVSCPNDSFSNPAARMMLLGTGSGATPIDLQAANGSTPASAVPLSNSWPRWSPSLQSINTSSYAWIVFSSTRDYGILVRNHQVGMSQCYPPDSYEAPGAAHGVKFAPTCQQPQLWLAAVNLTKAAAGGGDPSTPAVYLPFQDPTTHNHTPQWGP